MAWLKEELNERGVTAKACYLACEVSQPKWGKIEDDPGIMTAYQIKRLAKLLKYTPEELFQKILMYNDFMEEGS